MNFINKIPKIYLYGAISVMVVVGAVVVFWLSRGTGKAERNEKEYSYGTYVESKLADDVISYLSGYGVLNDADGEELADYSVQTYNAVLSSGASVITDEHSIALTAMFRDKLNEYGTGLSDTDIYALSNGISSYVWQAVLLSLDNYKESTMEPDYESEYLKLAESLQVQIDALEERSMNIHITARLKDDGKASLSGSDYDTVFTKYVNGALESVNSDMDKKLGDIETDITKSVDDDIDKKIDSMKSDIKSELNSDMTDDVKKKIDSMKSDITSELEKELKDSIKDGKDGKEGIAGKNGKDGEDGEDGKDGKDGQDGKSTYIAYADDASGNGFSLTPTETSKYIGTCITSTDRQPSSASEYSNWQLYRNYIITSTTDENNSTTLYIK